MHLKRLEKYIIIGQDGWQLNQPSETGFSG
jgi:hypothetical protein